MKRRGIGSRWAWAMLLAALPAAAIAQSNPSPGQPSGITQAQGSLDQTAPADQASDEAKATAKVEARARMDAILERGAKTSARSRADAEAKLQASAKQVDGQAAREGDARVAEQFAAEFGMTLDAVLAEKQALGASWGELMIAHTLAASSTDGPAVEELCQMKKDGHGWGQIAAGLGLNLGQTVSAARAEARVASGLAPADGKVQPIRAASVDVRGTTGAGIRGGHAGVGVKAGTGVSVKPGGH